MDRYRRQMLTIYQQEPLPIDMAEATRHIDEVEDTFYLQRPVRPTPLPLVIQVLSLTPAP